MPKPQHVHEVYIRTTPERLWQALTDPELTKDYYYGSRVSSTWEPGARTRTRPIRARQSSVSCWRWILHGGW